MNIKTNIYKVLPKVNRYLKISVGALAVVSFFMLPSCSGNDSLLNEEEESEQGSSNVTMDMKAVRPAIMDNSMLYVFDNGNNFVEKKLNVKRENDLLKMSMPVNTVTNPKWNFALLSCDIPLLEGTTGETDKIIRPNFGQSMFQAKMWTTGTIPPANIYMAQTPEEFRFDTIANVVIEKDKLTKANAVLNRNVAKIQIILKNWEGFDNISGSSNPFAYAELYDVPNTLNWAGRLFSTTNNIHSPVVSDKPMHVGFNFKTVNSKVVADTINFIVPADRGNLYNPADTTKHKIKLKLSMPITVNGTQQGYHGKTVDNQGKPIFYIPHVPKANGIIQVIVNKFTGEPDTNLDIKVSVKPWLTANDQNETFE